VKSLKPDFESKIAGAATRAVGRPGVPVVANAPARPPIAVVPRKKSALPDRRDTARPGAEPFDIADVLDRLPPSFDADGRRYPRFDSVPPNRERELEFALKDQWTELSARCIQIADLCNLQQQQTAELQTARDAVADLDKSVGLLHAALTHQEGETAAAQQALAQAQEETAALRAQLQATQNDIANSQQQARDLKAAFDDRGTALASARQRIEALEADLAAKIAEVEKLAASAEDADHRLRTELSQQRVRHEIEVRQLARSLAEREEQLARALAEHEEKFGKLQSTHALVAERCNQVSRKAEVLEAEQKTARDKLKSQAELVQVLEALLKVEREAAERKITELTAALEHERAARSAAETASAAMRKDIVYLLPKLVARRNGLDGVEMSAPMPRDDAA
jgi:DNA repair exonuclease SbcCD ATPase subunit